MSNLKYIAQNLETNLNEIDKFYLTFKDSLSDMELRCLKTGMDELFRLQVLLEWLERKDSK
ncbi:MAG: hypothetical protein WC055_15870 [Melioribacteraceae bacterium]